MTPRDRIIFIYDNNKSIETTIGQLNMFKWIIENNILQYIHDNYTQIDSDMIKSQKDNLEKKTIAKLKMVQSYKKEKKEINYQNKW